VSRFIRSWIKLPVQFLDDFSFCLLRESEHLLYFKLLLVAAEYGRSGRLPDEATLSGRLGISAKYLAPRLELLRVAGLIERREYRHDHFPLMVSDWCIVDPERFLQLKRPRVPGWGDIREAVLERDSYQCQYCGAEANHVDHIIPRCQGGSDDLDNLVAACEHCNCSKGGRTPEEAEMEMIDGTR